jgi:branched-chain amino acid transport system ATP-binding protein
VTAVLECHEVSAGYGGGTVIRDIGIQVSAGEIVALLGSNGAGKTTTLLTLAGALVRQTGVISVLGQDTGRADSHKLARLGLGYVPDNRGLFPGLSCIDNLWLAQRKRRRDVSEILKFFPDLKSKLSLRAGLLSGGEQQMLAIGRTLLLKPKVLLIDEVSLGLAPVIVERLLGILRRLADEEAVGILIVDQHVTFALDVADRAYVMHSGKIALQDSAAALKLRPEVIAESYLGDTAVR